MMLALLLAAAPPAMPADPGTLQPVAPAEAVALFKRVCVDPFPDPARFATVIADPALAMRKMPETPEQAMQPGDLWYSPRAEIAYAAADWLPRSLPSPQCSLTARLDAPADHSAIAAAAAASNGLDAGKTSGKDPVTTQWDVATAGGKVRYFLTTMEAFGGAYQLRLSILNLRDGKKK